MYINVIDVSAENDKVTKKGDPYTEIEVTFKDKDNKVGNKKLNSLGRDAGVKKVYATFKSAKKGDTFEVTSVKEGDFWNWKDVVPTSAQGAPSNTSTSNQSAGAARSSSYETSEERAARQVLIVKQSSLANAIAYHGQGKSQATEAKVLETAQKFTDWVMGVGVENIAKDSLEQEFDNDVPN